MSVFLLCCCLALSSHGVISHAYILLQQHYSSTLMVPDSMLICYHTKGGCTLIVQENMKSPFLTILSFVFRMLLRPTDLSDLKQLHPSVGSNLESLLTYQGADFHDTFSLTFEVPVQLIVHVSSYISQSWIPRLSKDFFLYQYFNERGYHIHVHELCPPSDN